MLKFESIQDFLDFLPGEERMLVEELRELVFECLPEAEERLSYNVPYYFGNRRICFIWPSSVPWGNVEQHGVILGFCEGRSLSDPLDYLEKGSRKQVFTRTFQSPDDINQGVLRSYLYEAWEIDQNNIQPLK